jgi:uncharacterized protein
MKALHVIAFILLIVGGLNWLIVGLMDQDLLMYLGISGTAAKVVYILVGLSAISELLTHKANCRRCNAQRAM